MPTKRIIKTFKAQGFTPIDVIEIILNINDYTNFIPYCTYSKVLEETEKWKIAKLIISFSVFKIPYISEIKFEEGNIVVSEYSRSNNKTFNYLENIWEVTEEGENIKINFFVDFAIKNKVLNILAGKMLGVISEIIINAFIKRLAEKKVKI